MHTLIEITVTKSCLEFQKNKVTNKLLNLSLFADNMSKNMRKNLLLTDPTTKINKVRSITPKRLDGCPDKTWLTDVVRRYRKKKKKDEFRCWDFQLSTAMAFPFASGVGCLLLLLYMSQVPRGKEEELPSCRYVFLYAARFISIQTRVESTGLLFYFSPVQGGI